MKYAIVTGTSRGLGEDIARLLLEHGVHVIGISRSPSQALVNVAQKNHSTYTQLHGDLGNINELEQMNTQLKEYLLHRSITELYLVNNAAVVQPVNQANQIAANNLSYHFHVNAIAPMALTNSLIDYANNNGIPMIGLTVTSGAAERPTYGWSAYCSTKASINMYTRTVALEQEQLGSKNKIVAFSPGIMDTEMQESIRSSSKDEFADIERFVAFKQNNQLRSTKNVAAILVELILEKNQIENGKIYNIGDFL
ncbi:(S)-benzoin forming benzil reductase [Virgibacillus salarius]